MRERSEHLDVICRRFAGSWQARQTSDFIAGSRLANWYVLQNKYFKCYLKRLAVCNNGTVACAGELMKHNGSRRVLGRKRITKKDCCDTLYVNVVIEGFRKKVKFGEENDIMFYSAWGNDFSAAASPSVTTQYIQTCYEKGKKEVMVLATTATCEMKILRLVRSCSSVLLRYFQTKWRWPSWVCRYDRILGMILF